VSTALKVAAIAEILFAILLGSWALSGGFGGETAPRSLRVGFAGYAVCAALIAAALLWRPRAASIIGVMFAIIYLLPAVPALASTELWQATRGGLARAMLLKLGLALASQAVALGALVSSRAWSGRGATGPLRDDDP
jgi:hypothetical protein